MSFTAVFGLFGLLFAAAGITAYHDPAGGPGASVAMVVFGAVVAVAALNGICSQVQVSATELRYWRWFRPVTIDRSEITSASIGPYKNLVAIQLQLRGATDPLILVPTASYGSRRARARMEEQLSAIRTDELPDPAVLGAAGHEPHTEPEMRRKLRRTLSLGAVWIAALGFYYYFHASHETGLSVAALAVAAVGAIAMWIYGHHAGVMRKPPRR
jgi:hypothetical protein